MATTQVTPIIELTTKLKTGEKKTRDENLSEFIDIKGWKSIGNKICGREFVKAKLKPAPKVKPAVAVEISEDNPTEEKAVAEKTEAPKPPLEEGKTETKTVEEKPTAKSKEPTKRVIAKKAKPQAKTTESSNKKNTEDKNKDGDSPDSFTSGDQISLL
jgi:outer membrane biosynthesis protein TonB